MRGFPEPDWVSRSRKTWPSPSCRVDTELRPLSRCADVEALSKDVEPPIAQEASAVEAIRSHLARARAAYEVGRYESAHVAANAAKGMLPLVDYPPVHAEVALQEAKVLGKRGAYAEAEAVLSRVLNSEERHYDSDTLQSVASALCRWGTPASGGGCTSIPEHGENFGPG